VTGSQALDETNDSIEQALQLYSHRQVKEGLSLWQLLQLPPPGPLGFAYFFVQTARYAVLSTSLAYLFLTFQGLIIETEATH
jgi:hypothetical protein